VTNPLPVVPEERILAAGFFDALIGQQDRHGGNLLVDQDRLYLIDHGFAFGRTGDGIPAAAPAAPRFHARQLTDGERGRCIGSWGRRICWVWRRCSRGIARMRARARAEIMLASGRVLPGAGSKMQGTSEVASR
jgi:hypothetical protein